MVLTSQLRYFIYGTVLSASLISISVSAGTADGMFGEYFKNIINNSCTTNSVVTGFSSIQNANYGKTNCSTIQSILGSIFGTSAAPDGQAMIGFNPDGTPKYGDVNWRKTGTDIGYSAGNVGIGTVTPGAKLDIQGGDLKLGNKVLRPGTDGWIRLGDTVGDYRGQGLAAGNLWTNGTIYSAGNIHSDTSITAPGFIVNTGGWGIQPNFSSSWSMVTQGYGGLNSNPQDGNGSIHVNDIYIRSIGKWASQLAAGSVPQGTLCGVAVRYWSGPISPYVSCQGQSIITSTTIPSGYTQPAGYDENGNYYPESWIDTSTTQQAWNCPSGYSPQQTTHANWGGQSGDDTWSCVKN